MGKASCSLPRDLRGNIKIFSQTTGFRCSSIHGQIQTGVHAVGIPHNIGKAHPVRKGAKWTSLAEILIKKHPRLAEFVRSPETALIYVEMMHCVHVTQFQTVSEWHKEKDPLVNQIFMLIPNKYGREYFRSFSSLALLGTPRLSPLYLN